MVSRQHLWMVYGLVSSVVVKIQLTMLSHFVDDGYLMYAINDVLVIGSETVLHQPTSQKLPTIAVTTVVGAIMSEWVNTLLDCWQD